jgi:hypothetical protein
MTWPARLLLVLIGTHHVELGSISTDSPPATKIQLAGSFTRQGDLCNTPGQWKITQGDPLSAR